MRCVTVFTCEKLIKFYKKKKFLDKFCHILIKLLCFLINILAKKSECDIMH